jgi:leader peptidase (prepilin peptidase) / N-methyltransferase
MHNLEEKIVEWRKRMTAGGINSRAVLDELESHLRDEVEQQLRSGANEQKAFEAGVLRIGQAGRLKCEFAKVDETRQVLRQKTVWALIGVAAFCCWLNFRGSPALALVYGILLAGLVAASLIDFKYFIIPDEITIGGIVVGILCSCLLPLLHGQNMLLGGMLQSLLGVGVGAGLLYLIARVGKLAFGRQRIALTGDTKIVFTDTVLVLPEREIPYADLFYRKSDVIALEARTVELAGDSYRNVPVRLTPTSLQIGQDKFNPAAITRMEAVSAEIVLPREAMGFGDVKFMAAIGAFLGWQAVVFSLIASSLLGSLVCVGLIAARRREWSSRLPYGPYIALAAAIWIFGGKHFVEAVFAQ